MKEKDERGGFLDDDEKEFIEYQKFLHMRR